MTGPTQSQDKPESSAPLRIIWLEDGPYVATEPTESTMSKVHEVKSPDGKVTTLVHRQQPSVMVSRALKPATRDQVEEWRVRT